MIVPRTTSALVLKRSHGSDLTTTSQFPFWARPCKTKSPEQDELDPLAKCERLHAVVVIDFIAATVGLSFWGGDRAIGGTRLRQRHFTARRYLPE